MRGWINGSVILITFCVDLLIRIHGFIRKCLDLLMQMGGFSWYVRFQKREKTNKILSVWHFWKIKNKR